MLPYKIKNIIQLGKSARSVLHLLQLKSGDFISVNVIKNLTQNKWAVAIRGRVFPAFSQLELQRGQIIKARVIISGNKINLKIINDKSNNISELLFQQGLPQDSLSALIINNLLKNGMGLDYEIIKKFREILLKLKGDKTRLARIISLLLAKKISINSINLQRLIGVLNFGDKGNREQRGYKRHKFSFNRQELKKQIKQVINPQQKEEHNALQIFNHLKASQNNWIIIPYNFSFKQQTLAGTIRILYQPYTEKIEKMVIIAHTDDNTRWDFAITPQKEKIQLSIYCNNEESTRISQKRLKELQTHLNEFNVTVDKNIKVGTSFDGFTEQNQEIIYKKIDTIT